MRIGILTGTRPDIIKMAPLYWEAKSRGHAPVLIHTGQHYDREMNDVFFEELGIPQPDVFMAAGGGSHAQRIA